MTQKAVDAPHSQQMIPQCEGDAIASLVVHRTLLDRNDPLRSRGVMPHYAVAKYKRDLATET